MKVYTKKGDKGYTSLLSGERVSKTDIRIDAVGVLDELNSFVGLLRSEMFESDELEKIQWTLFNAGALVIKDDEKYKLVEITEEDILFLERSIDKMQSELPELKNFILPKGSRAVSTSHLCRTVCRRAERTLIQLNSIESNEIIVKYLNRLSDYFFVLSRYIGHTQNINETIWSNKN